MGVGSERDRGKSMNFVEFSMRMGIKDMELKVSLCILLTSG